MELGSVTLKRIGFFCFPIKHSTHKHTSYSILTDFHTSMLGMVGLGKKNLSAVRGAPAFGPGLPSVCVFIIAGPMMIKLFAGGRRRVEDMCYERRQAEACVDESAHHALSPSQV
jgi:hypothetical protein